MTTDKIWTAWDNIYEYSRQSTREINHFNTFPSYSNNRYLDDEAESYELEKFKKHKMLIFNQINCPDRDPRRGTEKDVKSLKDCFERRAFEIEVYDDCEKNVIFDIMEETTAEDLSDYGCFAVVVLTHGSYYGKLFAKNDSYNETELIEYFDTPGLHTKPKILIIQACRGSEISQSVQVGGTNRHYQSEIDNLLNNRVVNIHDLLILYSTFPGKKAHRNTISGSWFIQSLCKCINESKADDDIHSVFTCVLHDISADHEHQSPESSNPVKQMPVSVSTLTRNLYLNGHLGNENMTQDTNQERNKEIPNVGDDKMNSNNYEKGTTKLNISCRFIFFSIGIVIFLTSIHPIFFSPSEPFISLQ